MKLEKEAIFFLPLIVFLAYSTIYLYGDVFNDIPRDGDIDEWMYDVDAQTLSEYFDPYPREGTAPTGTYYRPIQKISWKIQKDMWGPASSNYRIFWIFIHIIVSTLVYAFARKLSLTRGTAFLSALLFSILRVNVHIVKREIAMAGHGLASIFLIITFIFFIDYLRKKRLKYYIATFFFFVLTVLTCESAMVLLPLMMLYQLFVEGETLKKKRLVKTGLAYIPYIILTLIILFFSRMKYPTGFVANMWGGSYFGLFTVTRLVDYISMLVFPFTQTGYITHILLYAVLILAWLTACKYKKLDRFLVLWIIICILPFSFSNFRGIEGLWRYLYFSSIAFSILTAKTINQLFMKRKLRLIAFYSLAFWIANIAILTGFLEATL